jgi:hypothetical protein
MAQSSAETATRTIGRPFPKGVSGNPGGGTFVIDGHEVVVIDASDAASRSAVASQTARGLRKGAARKPRRPPESVLRVC